MGKKLKQFEQDLDKAFENYGLDSNEYKRAYDNYDKYINKRKLTNYILGGLIILNIGGLGALTYYSNHLNKQNNSSRAENTSNLEDKLAKDGHQNLE